MYIALAHELIHADRAMRGICIPDYYKTFYKYSFMDASGNITKENDITDIDEMLTIGLICPGYRLSYDDVTENQIRAEHGLYLRGAHYEH